MAADDQSRLDDEARRLLELLQRKGLLDPVTNDVEEMRRRTIREREFSFPRKDLPSVKDVEFPGFGGKQRARIYIPRRDKVLPVTVFYHGGGFVVGDIEDADPVCRMLAHHADSVVVSFAYRKAPEYRFPAAFEDAWAGLCWTAESLDVDEADRSRLIVAGESAGGNLAAAVALAARDRGGPDVRLQVLIYPGLDLTCRASSYEIYGAGYGTTSDEIEWFWSQYLPSKEAAHNQYASPLAAARFDALPPALIILAECDPARDDGLIFAERLKEAGGIGIVSIYPGHLHGFVSCGGVCKKAAEGAVREIAAAIGRLASERPQPEG